MKKIASFLALENIVFYENELLSKHCTWRIGGNADLLCIPQNADELSKVLFFLSMSNINWLMLGKGSNILFPDIPLRKVVIKLGGVFDQAEIVGDKIVTGAAHSLIRLSLAAAKHGLSGLEFAAGIPGSLGGAVSMNAGAHGTSISEIFHSAEVMNERGEIVFLKKEDMNFQYRASRLTEDKLTLLKTTLRLTSADPLDIGKKTASFKQKRASTQPLNMPSCGSVFKNPLPHYAAELIENCGLKGRRAGGAQISDVHANFIVNLENASSADVKKLMSLAQSAVLEKFGVMLAPEVKIL